MAASSSSDAKRYRRVLLKLSGEALMGEQGHGIDVSVVERIARDVAAVRKSGIEICLVVGGGNIFRGLAGAAKGMDRAAGDHMGMLATVINALALENELHQVGCPTRAMSAIPMPTVCEPFVRQTALRHLDDGKVVVFGAGTGNPFFTTDTAAALRAAEMKCDALLKGTQVDGVYAADPKSNPGAERYDRLSYDDVLAKNLKVMDATAIALARDSNIPIVVFSIHDDGNLARVLAGDGRSTTISA